MQKVLVNKGYLLPICLIVVLFIAVSATAPKSGKVDYSQDTSYQKILGTWQYVDGGGYYSENYTSMSGDVFGYYNNTGTVISFSFGPDGQYAFFTASRATSRLLSSECYAKELGRYVLVGSQVTVYPVSAKNACKVGGDSSIDDALEKAPRTYQIEQTANSIKFTGPCTTQQNDCVGGSYFMQELKKVPNN